ncbi:unnamed protein product [Microthlaspi erraticum]|uniref:Uncharacterized protein n=1 Tax=Microthlaspi erraticum TaxID=1685480 RepID=A0A6D2LQJ7_9BRAS|nr:unnamed protein product [Microthlaspi erraticum]
MNLWDVVEKGVHQEPPYETSPTSNDLDGESLDASSSAAEYNLVWWKHWTETNDTTALYIIQTALSHEILPWIASATSSKEAWEILQVRSLGGPIFQSRKLIDLEKEYEDMRMKDSETVIEFTGKLMELVFRMKSYGWKVEDKGQEPLEKSVIKSLDVEESVQEEAEILYSLNEITQSQVASMERQGEVLSLVQQNQKMMMQLQKQMVALMQHTL